MATTWEEPKTYLLNNEHTNYTIDPPSILLFLGVKGANMLPSHPKKEGAGAIFSTFFHNKSALKTPFAHGSAPTVLVCRGRN